MARYIDKDVLINDLCAGLCGAYDQCKEWCYTLKVIHMQPVIDGLPVRQGKCIRLCDGEYYCSECQAHLGKYREYCGRCGAKMDGGEDDG